MALLMCIGLFLCIVYFYNGYRLSFDKLFDIFYLGTFLGNMQKDGLKIKLN